MNIQGKVNGVSSQSGQGSIELDAAHRVGMTVYALRSTITDLWKLRMGNATSDLMLAEESALFLEAGKLHALITDIMTANDNGGALRRHLQAAE